MTEASFEQVAVQLAAALDALPEAELIAAGEQIDEIATAVHRAVAGTSHSSAQETVTTIGAAREALVKALQQIGVVRAKVREYAAAVHLGGLGGAAPAAPAPAAPGRSALDVILGSGDGTTFALRQAGRQLPQRPGGRGRTHGQLLDIAGQPVTDRVFSLPTGQLRSGAVPAARDGLRADWHPDAQVTFEHVEAHAAALMRRPGAPREAALIVNKQTCRSSGSYVGCHEALPGMVPEGARLAVYQSDGNRTWLQHVYTGTGEGIA